MGYLLDGGSGIHRAVRSAIVSGLSLALFACGASERPKHAAAPPAVVVARPKPPIASPSAAAALGNRPESAPMSEPAAPRAPVQLTAVSVGRRAFLGGVAYSESLPGCSYEVQVPELVRLPDQALQQRINVWLEGGARAEARDFCRDAPPDAAPAWSLTRSFEVDVVQSDLVAIRFETDSYFGGAHGGQLTECHVLDLVDGKSFQLEERVLPAKRARLNQMFKKKVKDSEIAQQAQADGMPVDDVDISSASTFCAMEGGFFVQLGSYVLGAYSLGRPTFAFSSDEARPLFDSALSKRLFP
jgi:Deacetylase PdaC